MHTSSLTDIHLQSDVGPLEKNARNNELNMTF